MALVRPAMMTERKPLALPPPVVFSPRPTHTTLATAHSNDSLPPVPLPPTPPPPQPFDPTAPLPSLADLRARLSASDEPAAPLPIVVGTPADTGHAAAQTRPPAVPTRKVARYDFDYADRDAFETEINEFYNFQDQQQMEDGRLLFEATFAGQWKSAKPSRRANYVAGLLEHMELRDADLRYKAVKKLLYISQGAYGEAASQPEHVELIVANNQLLFALGTLEHIYAGFKVASQTLDVVTRAAEPTTLERQYAMEQAISEVTAHMCLLGMLIEVHLKDETFATELISMNPPVASFLFTLVDQLAEANRKRYPVKKLLLLLWKVLTVSLGTSDQLASLKTASRTLEGLDPFDEATLVKSTPQDYHNFHLVAATRYPAYVTPNADSLCPPRLQLVDPIPTCIRRQLQQAAVLQPYVSTDKLLPTLFDECVDLYRKHNYVSLASVQIARERDRMSKEEERRDVDGAASELEDVVEALDDEALSASHLGSERRRDVFALRPSVKRNAKRIKKQDAAGLKRVEEIYRHLVPQMPVHVGMLIRLLYYVNLGAANSVPSSGGGSKADGDSASTPGGDNPADDGSLAGLSFADMTPDQKREHLMKADNNRHREVVTKAISGILVLLLKASKCSHALKFEYIAQLLVDNNCAILILKMLSTWLQSPSANPSPVTPGPPGQQNTSGGTSWAERAAATPPRPPPAVGLGMGALWLTKKEEPKEIDFFHFARAEDPFSAASEITPTVSSSAEREKEETAAATSPATPSGSAESPLHSPTGTGPTSTPPPDIPSSFRNFYTAINLLRILQKLTKRKTHRVLALVQWKASAVLKRAIKVSHVGIQLYALKLLKSQIPYLGKKWRSTNMKIITAIFIHLRPCLRDEYLAGDVDVDVDEALAHEQRLRAMIASYHAHRYPEASGEDGPTSGNGAGENGRAASPTHSHVDELELILSISRRGSYEGASDPQMNRFAGGPGGSGSGNLLLPSAGSAYEPLTLDPNFMENYEEWLRMEVYDSEPSPPSPTSSSSLSPPVSPADGWPHEVEHHWGDPIAAEQHEPTRSLFSATRRFSKDMLSDDYDDSDWTWDADGESTTAYRVGDPDADEYDAFHAPGGGDSVWADDPAPSGDMDDPSRAWATTVPMIDSAGDCYYDRPHVEDDGWDENRDDHDEASAHSSESSDSSDGAGSADSGVALVDDPAGTGESASGKKREREGSPVYSWPDEF
ncbi:Factor arrest protein 11 [Geranomyces variabilis]|nr:Factor arrest protein 11 [Geranomyces variabilis]